MIDGRLLSFSVIALALALTPGADIALVVRNAISRGRQAGVLTTMGVCSACAVHATASSLGLSLILATSATAFEIVKYVGAAYLLYLGIRSIRAARRAPEAVESPDKSQPVGPPRSAHVSFLEGMLTNLLNPKVAIFYLLVLPQFIASGEPVFPKSMLLAGIHIGCGFVVLYTCILFVERMRGWLATPRVKARLEVVTGGILMLLGLRLAIEHR